MGVLAGFISLSVGLARGVVSGEKTTEKHILPFLSNALNQFEQLNEEVSLGEGFSENFAQVVETLQNDLETVLDTALPSDQRETVIKCMSNLQRYQNLQKLDSDQQGNDPEMLAWMNKLTKWKENYDKGCLTQLAELGNDVVKLLQQGDRGLYSVLIDTFLVQLLFYFCFLHE